MKIYKVVWEEKVYIIIEARSEKDAIEKVMVGDYEEDPFRLEITCPPEEATEIK